MAWSNAWFDVIRANWSSLLLFLDHRQGTWDDYSSYARTVTQTATGGINCEWSQGTNGKDITVGGTSPVTANHGRLVVTANAALAITRGTLVFFGNWGRSTGQNARLCEFRAASTYFDIYAPLTTGIDYFDGGGGHAFAFPAPAWETTRSVGFVLSNSVLPRCYHNGVSLGTAGAVCQLPGGVVPAIHLYNYNTGAVGDPWWRWHCVLLFDATLAPSAISQLHADWLASPHSL